MRRRRRHTGTTALAHRSAATSSAWVVLWVEIDAGANSNPLFAPIRNTRDHIYKLYMSYQTFTNDGFPLMLNVSYTSFYHFSVNVNNIIKAITRRNYHRNQV